jgi:hypothetical protein
MFVEPPCVTAMVAVPVLVPSAMEVAVSLTVDPGTLAGGDVYVTGFAVVLLSVPHPLPLHPVPESDHVTPLL